MEKEKKIQILKTAIKRFIRHGKNKTTLDEIARDLRMSKSSLYHYFNSKDDLYNEALKYEFESYLADVLEVFNSPAEFSENITSYLSLKQQFSSKYKLAFDTLILLLNGQNNDTEGIIITEVLKEEEILIRKIIKKNISKSELTSQNLTRFLVFQSWGLIINYNLFKTTNPELNSNFIQIIKAQFDSLLV